MSTYTVVIWGKCPDGAKRLRTYSLSAPSYPKAQQQAITAIRQELGCGKVRVVETFETL